MIQAHSGDELIVRLMDGEELAACLAALKVDSGVILNGVGMLRKLELGYWSGSGYEITRIDGSRKVALPDPISTLREAVGLP